jgi:branched-chain amino acid transport system ATP-binding protein
MDTPLLALNGVTKRFGGLTAVNDVTFDVFPGDTIGLMGPNGAGKSTLINVITGELKPDDGQILFKGESIVGMKPHQVCRRGIGRSYQIPRPFAHMTVLENVMVAASFGRGLSKAEARAEAIKILKITGLEDKSNVFTRDLQELTLKRLEMARSLASRPALVFLDEVAAGLTEEELPVILDLLKDINQIGITILLVEHIMRIMAEAVDRIVVVENGIKIAEGLPEEIMNNPKVIKAYFG